MKSLKVFLFCSTLLTTNSAFAMDQAKALEIAGATGCALLASLLPNPQAVVAAGGACIAGTEVAKDWVKSLIDEHFAAEDQEFANKYCLTIARGDGSKVVPTDQTNCAE